MNTYLVFYLRRRTPFLLWAIFVLRGVAIKGYRFEVRE